MTMALDKHNRGFVLVSVLWILAILTVMSLGFGRRAMMERKVAWYALDHAQALQMARGAAERGIAEIANKQQIDMNEKKTGYVGRDQRWARVVDILHEEDYFEAGTNPDFDEDTCGYRIIDSGSRVSVNNAPERLLAEIDGLSLTAIRKIMSRRMGGDNRDLVPSFSSLEEIRQLPGISDAEWNGQNPGEGLKDILTVWGADYTVNLNTVSEVVLRSLPKIRGEVIEPIIAYRKGEDGIFGTNDDKAIRDWNQLSDTLGIKADKLADLRQFCSLTSGRFLIEAWATRRQGKIIARVSVVVNASGARSVQQWSEDGHRS